MLKATPPRVVFRVEPEKPILLQALRDINYGTAMQEADAAIIRASLQNILDLFMTALKATSTDSPAFSNCFKNKTNWSIVVVILRRCEDIIKYCLAHDGMQYVQQSLGTLRFIKGSGPRLGKKSCRILAAQNERTIWLYEAWWNAPSLRSSIGVKPEKGHGARVLDSLSDAFMQTKEGTLLHEIVHLASIGQMKRLLSPKYPRRRLPVALWRGRDWVDDAVFHEHVNANLVCESIMDAKYRWPKKGGGWEFTAAYHLDGVRDLVCLENGDVASVLNAESYNGFASLALMDRVRKRFANHQNNSRADVDFPNLHPDATSRLRQALSKTADMLIERRNDRADEVRKTSFKYNCLDSIAARDRNGCFSDLGSWPTPAEAAAADA